MMKMGPIIELVVESIILYLYFEQIPNKLSSPRILDDRCKA